MLKEIIAGVSFIVLLMCGTLWAIIAQEATACEQYSDMTGRPTKYQFPAGGFIQHKDDSWLSRTEYRAVIVAREGLTK